MTDATLTIQAKWAAKSETFTVPLTLTVGQLQNECMRRFGMETCKMVGLVKGKLPEMETVLSTLHPPNATVKLMLIGVPSNTLASMGERESVYEAHRLVEAEEAARAARALAEREARLRKEREEYEAMESIRRREREEQRQRDHAAWEVRRREEEAAARERELKAEQDVRNTLSLELQAFHSPALDATQKLLLPPHALQEIVNAKIQFPLTFQLLKPESVAAVQAESMAAASAAAHANETSSTTAAAAASSTSLTEESKMDASPRSYSLAPDSVTSTSAPPIDPTSLPILSPLVAYYGVQDFTAPLSTVSVPFSLLRALNVEDGAKLRLTTVNLRKAQHIVIQPLTAAWTKLPELERRALLEFQLRKHTFLVQDSKLSFSYHPHLPTFEFRVMETKPDPVVSITDTELSTEILPYEDSLTAMSDTMGAPSSISSTSTATPSSSATKEIPKLTPDETISGKLTKGATVNFLYEVTDPNMSVTIEVKSISGDIDLYILNTDASDSLVDIANHTWSAQSKGSKTLTLSAKDPLFQTGIWQVQLRAYGSDGEFQLVVKETHLHSSTSFGYSLSGSSSTAPTAAAATPAPDTTQCSNCKSFISARAMPMHSAQCARLNYCCPQCQLVIKTSEKDKHQELVHSTYTCLCGMTYDQPGMIQHKRESCSLRLVPCQYCPLKLVVAERGSHQYECGMLHSACPLCAASIQRKVMRRHLVKQHGGINNKVDEREITFQDFWC